ncbi:MAG: Hsp20/alpha crystallin family protein [Dorea sp.]|nr:Hsp20/alpha crystallin family protein [Dorea sp.]
MLMPSMFRNTLFDNFFNDMSRFTDLDSYSTGLMKTDVKEHDEAYELDIELPGYSKDDVKAELKDGYLTISAETNKSNDEKDTNGRYIRRERHYGSCSRSFYVGKDLKTEDIKAKFENGILVIAVPKLEAVPEVPANHFISIEG